jgi:2,4'-dihydroxyacetophenone dioxygenase
MTVTHFTQTFTSGLSSRTTYEFVQHTDLDNDIMWVPLGDGVWFQPCSFNLTTGAFANVVKVLPGKQLDPHYHPCPTFGFTIRGKWHHLEHDWMAGPGTYVYEASGELHTVAVPADATEPMITFFVVHSGLIYVDKEGKISGYDDAFTILETARAHYRANGLPVEDLDKLIC